ncbi:MAG: hypothetical protein ACRD3J_02465, partial [Thermoanaerobaculia bacterium]
MPTTKTYRLTLYLAKPSITDPADLVHDTTGVTTHRVTIPGCTQATLYLKTVGAHDPAWTRLFRGATTPPIRPRVSTASGLL